MFTKQVKGEKMENQIKIDYENMPNQSNSIRGQAIEINNKLLAIYRNAYLLVWEEI